MSMINTVLQNDTAVTAGGLIPWGLPVHGNGAGITLRGNTITVSGKGFYEVIASVTGSVPAGAATIKLMANGSDIQGAKATITNSGSAAAAESVTVIGVVLIRCCESVDLTLSSSVAGTITNVNAIIRKVG